MHELTLAAMRGERALDAVSMKRLTSLQGAADEAYLNGHTTQSPNDASTQKAMADFYRARALAAVLYVIRDVDGTNASEAVYEALASYDDEGEAMRQFEEAVRG